MPVHCLNIDDLITPKNSINLFHQTNDGVEPCFHFIFPSRRGILFHSVDKNSKLEAIRFHDQRSREVVRGFLLNSKPLLDSHSNLGYGLGLEGQGNRRG